MKRPQKPKLSTESSDVNELSPRLRRRMMVVEAAAQLPSTVISLDPLCLPQTKAADGD
jgi:hypothetical protein